MNRWKLNKLIFLSFPFSSNIRKPMKLALIGGGNMGGALLKALVKSNTLAASDTLLIEPDSGKRENLVRETGCRAKASMDDEIAGADCMLLAVKPQSATDVMPTLKPLLTGNPMLISVMAGVSMQSLEEGLGLKKLVRVMPNTPALVGEGMSVYFAKEAVNDEEREWIRKLFSSCGKCMEVKSENAIDAATAVSGSGPAYLFYLAEQMIEAAKNLGFQAEQAETLVKQTLKGASLLLQEQESAAELRRRVTSPGGTTEAALKRFAEGKVEVHLKDGLEQAYLRARELSGRE